MIDLPEDFRDLLVELADAGAEFVIVGGHAVAFHGHPRATKDLDVLVRERQAHRALLGARPPAGLRGGSRGRHERLRDVSGPDVRRDRWSEVPQQVTERPFSINYWSEETRQVRRSTPRVGFRRATSQREPQGRRAFR